MDISNWAHIPLRRGGALGGSRTSDGGVVECCINETWLIIDSNFAQLGPAIYILIPFILIQALAYAELHTGFRPMCLQVPKSCGEPWAMIRPIP